jgi:predicted HTH transcriptional regulator
MSSDSGITTRSIADTVGINVRNAESHIRVLKKAGLIEREGSRKNGRWIVKRQS